MLLRLIDGITCSCLNELDVRLGIMLCLIHTFSQSIIGAMYVSFPYIIVPCLGIFFSIFYILQMRERSNQISSYLLLLFLSEEFISIYAILYGISKSETLFFMILHGYFLLSSTLGVCFSYRLGEVIRQRTFAVLSPSINQV
jgi:hypothetical protein